jgi:hypothetical protein
MSRLFNTQVFSGNIGNNSNSGYFSDPSFNDLMGQADEMLVQAFCDSAPASETVTVSMFTSNDNINWQPVSGFTLTLSINVANSFPQTQILATSSGPPGGFVRLQVTAANNSSGDAVRVIVCGRVGH